MLPLLATLSACSGQVPVQRATGISEEQQAKVLYLATQINRASTLAITREPITVREERQQRLLEQLERAKTLFERTQALGPFQDSAEEYFALSQVASEMGLDQTDHSLVDLQLQIHGLRNDIISIELELANYQVIWEEAGEDPARLEGYQLIGRMRIEDILSGAGCQNPTVVVPEPWGVQATQVFVDKAKGEGPDCVPPQ